MDTTTDDKTCIEADFLDNALVLIAILGENGKIVSWNHAAETITGFSPRDVIGSNAIWKNLYPDKNYRDSITKKIAEILATKQYFENFETTIRTRLGEKRTVLWNTKKIFDRGNPRTITVGIDVTAERAAMEFRESIIDNAYVLMAVLGPKGTVLVWNKAAEMITGYKPGEVIGGNGIWKKLYPDPGYRTSVTQRIMKIISAQNYFENLETTIRTKAGEERIISWNTRRIGNGTYHEIAIGRDITEQRKAEQSLVAYMTEMTMRLKQPMGIIGNTLLESAELVRQGMLTQDEIILVLQCQARNMAQIEANVTEFQNAIVEKNRSIPDAYREFLER